MLELRKNNKPHTLVIENSKTKDRTNYSFADPKEDAKQITDFSIKKMVINNCPFCGQKLSDFYKSDDYVQETIG